MTPKEIREALNLTTREAGIHLLGAPYYYAWLAWRRIERAKNQPIPQAAFLRLLSYMVTHYQAGDEWAKRALAELMMMSLELSESYSSVTYNETLK